MYTLCTVVKHKFNVYDEQVHLRTSMQILMLDLGKWLKEIWDKEKLHQNCAGESQS